MNFSKVSEELQKPFLDKLSTELRDKASLNLYYTLAENFHEYCYGMENAESNYYTMIYYIPAKRPLVFPPLIIPSLSTNIKMNLTFTVSFLIPSIKKNHNPQEIVFLYKKGKKTGDAIESLKEANNGKIYNTEYYAVCGSIDGNISKYKTTLDKAEFKQWKDIGDENISKLLDVTFQDSLDKKIANGIMKNTMRNDFKNKSLSRDDCIVMGADGKAVGIAFPHAIQPESTDEIRFGSAYYMGIIPKMRDKGHATTLFLSCIDRLINLGCNFYKGKVHKDNEKLIAVYKKFGLEVYDSLMTIDTAD